MTTTTTTETELTMPTLTRPSLLSFEDWIDDHTPFEYVSNTANPKYMSPKTAANLHAKAMIATLHPTMQPNLLKLTDMFHDEFFKFYNYEEQLEKLQNNSDHIPASARIKLSHKGHYHEDIRGGMETKALDAETSAVVAECQKKLATQVLKALQLNQAAQKMTLLKILSDILLHSATGFLTLYNVSKTDKNYSAHQAVSDMMFCYGQGVLYSLFVDAMPTEFVKAYNASTKHHLPQPTKINQRSLIEFTNQTSYFNPYMNDEKDKYDRNRKRSYVPSRSTPAYNRKSLGSVAGLSFKDFDNLWRDMPDDPWCATGCTTEKPPANLNDGTTSSSQSTSAAANENSLLSQPEDSTAAAAASLRTNQLLFGNDAVQDDIATENTAPRPEKRARLDESDENDEENHEVHGSSQMQQSSEDDATIVQQPSEDEATVNTRGTQKTNDIEIVLPIKDFLEGLGKEKSRVVSNLHWFITTAINGSINLYVETDNLKTKNLEMKKVMEAVNKGRLADDTHYKYSNERSIDAPLLNNVVESMVNKKMNPIKASIQSIKARTNNKKMKNVQPQASRKTSKRDSKKSLKEQRGAQPISTGAALQKKKKSNRNSATPTPTPKSILKSTVNKAALNKAVLNQDQRAGGSNGDTKTVQFGNVKPNSKKRSGGKKKSMRTKKNNNPKASTRT